MSPTIVYRAFDTHHSAGTGSAHGFTAGLSEYDHQDDDCDSIEDHFNAASRYLTPWISTTSNLLRAIKRAQQLSDRHGSSGVHIAVILVEECNEHRYFLAESLAEQFDLTVRWWHGEEYLFRWEIPCAAVVSCLRLETLEERGLYSMVPELLQRCSADKWKQRMLANWREDQPDRHLSAAGCKAAKLAFLFGDGEHTEYVALEAAGWWEDMVGRIVKGALYRTLAGHNDTSCCFHT